MSSPLWKREPRCSEVEDENEDEDDFPGAETIIGTFGRPSVAATRDGRTPQRFADVCLGGVRPSASRSNILHPKG